MDFRTSARTGLLLLATWLLASAAAMAQEAVPTDGKPATPAFAQAIASDRLEDLRAGTNVRNDMTLAGTTAGNSATQVSTGSNAIDGGAFANMSGMPVVIQNSGANVLIQNALILHLQMN